jgi:acyl-[acyl carrier protein]--UDP-N-acetylglucosamine O-acyltransferase
MIGLARHRFEPHQIERLRVAYRRLFKRENGSWTEALASLTEEYPDDPNVMELCRFVRDMSKSTNGRHAELLRQDNKRVTPPR